MQLVFFPACPLMERIANCAFGCAITTELQNKCLNKKLDPTAQRTLANFHAVPELRRRGGESERNIAARRLRDNGYDRALLRLIVCLVRYHDSLARLDATRHPDQSASFMDGDGKRLLVKRIATRQRTVDEQRELGIRPAVRAGTRVLGNQCFRHLDVLALQRNNSTQFTPPTKAGLLVNRTVRKNWTAYVEPRKFQPRAAERRLVLQQHGTHGQAKCPSCLALRPVVVPRTLRDYSGGSLEIEG
jgi:hypothetical protein